MKQEQVTREKDPTVEWDAFSYEEMADPMTRWGAEFLELVEIEGDEAVVDAGCGTGRVTGLLLGRLPGGTVLAVDVSEKMVEAAAERFAGEKRVTVGRQDLMELEAGRPVDLIFSSATFHWMPDHDLLFRRLAGNLKPGGLLAAQCGGAGNIARVLDTAREVMREERFREAFDGWTDTLHFADPATTKSRLERAGFEKVETWLHEEPTKFDSVEELARFLKTVNLRRHVAALPEKDHEAFVRAIAERMAENLVVDYIRLNILARRGGRRVEE